jgi:cytochrome oxidase Cu insertion factor (SCO1/SenC/PrrC family)
MAESKSKAGSWRSVFALLLAFGPALVLILIATNQCKHKFKRLDDFGPLPKFEFTTSDGKVLTNESFKNDIVIYTTIQPTCPDSCGITIWHLDQLIFQITRNKKRLEHLKIVSIVTDYEGNSSDNLKDVEFMLKDRVDGYNPKRWMVVKGDPKQIFNVENNGVNLIHKSKEFFGGISYQELMILADTKNHIRMIVSGKTEDSMRTMRDYMSLLEREYKQNEIKD